MYHGGGGGGGGEDSKVLYTQLHLTYLPTSQHTSHVHRPDAKRHETMFKEPIMAATMKNSSVNSRAPNTHTQPPSRAA